MAAALAPTDAALGVPVVTNPVVPSRVRRLITVESGLNDGITTPVVMLAIAGVASAERLSGAVGLGEALIELATGAVVGVAVGSAGGWLLRWSRRHGWVSEDFAARRFWLSWSVYAVLSLTLVRMLPVALASVGAGLDRNTVLFVGWFGPRGLASLVFALLALEDLGPAVDEAVSVVAVTVLLSVIAHGVSAPLASRYGQAAATRGPEPGGPLSDLPVRGLPRRTGTGPQSEREPPGR